MKIRCSSRWMGAAVLALGVFVATPGCTPTKKVYTIPSVTKDIEGSIRSARSLKSSGKLKQASERLLKVSNAVLKEYPQTTLTQEPVKKLLTALEWMANMCLDRSLELKNEAVSAAEDDLSKTFRKWSDVHRENLSAIRKMLPNLKKAAVAARRPPPARPGSKARPAPASGGEPGARPKGNDTKQPRPSEPVMPGLGGDKEPG